MGMHTKSRSIANHSLVKDEDSDGTFQKPVHLQRRKVRLRLTYSPRVRTWVPLQLRSMISDPLSSLKEIPTGNMPRSLIVKPNEQLAWIFMNKVRSQKEFERW